MAAGTFTLFSKNKNHFNMADLQGATLKMLLTSSSYSPDVTVTGNYLKADVTNELSTANGYTAGGVTLTTVVDPTITGGYKLSSDSPAWTASGGNIAAWRNAVLYVSGTLWGLTNPLVGYMVGDSTPADVPATSSGNTLTLTVPGGGWFDVT